MSWNLPALEGPAQRTPSLSASKICSCDDGLRTHRTGGLYSTQLFNHFGGWDSPLGLGNPGV